MCITRPCANGARCQDVFGDYRCSCANGFAGRRCEKDVNECSILRDSACENGGRCVNVKGSYECQCTEGFEGARCGKRIQRILPTAQPAQPRSEQKSSKSILNVLAHKNNVASSNSASSKKVSPRQSSTNIKYTHIVRQVEVNAVNPDGSFADHVEKNLVQVRDTIDTSEQASISIVQAVTFSFLGVAIILFVIIAFVVWLHYSKRKNKKGCCGFKHDSFGDRQTPCANNRNSIIIDNQSDDTADVSEAIDSFNLRQEKVARALTPSSVLHAEKSRSPVDFLYVSLPQNNSICSRNSNMNRNLKDSIHVS